jgi:hypothetical protein
VKIATTTDNAFAAVVDAAREVGLLRLLTAAYGTKLPAAMSAHTSAFRGKADHKCSRRAFPVLTQSGFNSAQDWSSGHETVVRRTTFCALGDPLTQTHADTDPSGKFTQKQHLR